MAARDLHNNIKPLVGLNVTAIGSNTTTNGNVIDTQGFDSVEYLTTSGTVTDGTFTPVLEQADDLAFSVNVETIPTVQLLGTIADATFVAADDDAVKKIGVLNNRQFVRLSYASTGVTTGATLTALAVMGKPYLSATT